MKDRSCRDGSKRAVPTRRRVILAAILSLSIGACSLPAAAAYALPAEKTAQTAAAKAPADAAATIVKKTDGSISVCRGIPGQSSLDKMLGEGDTSGYEVFYDGKSVLSANAMPAISTAQLNGYYSVSFTFPDTNKEAFITGLSSDALEKVQSSIVAHYADGYDFDIEDLDIIDTEKTADVDNDDLLCWAAATSNILHYSGWGAAGGFETEDDLFELFIRDNDESGSEQIGVAWFIDGLKFLSDNDPDEAPSGGFVKDYTADVLTTVYDFKTDDPTKTISEVFERLRNGYAVSMDIDTIYWGTAHAVTVWGFVLNNDYTPDQKEHYDAIILTDSDTDELEGVDRRTAKNKLNVRYMTPYNGKTAEHDDYFEDKLYDSWILEGYSSMVLMSMTTLKPYGSVEPETDPKATKDKRASVDLMVKDCIAFTDDTPISYITDFEIETIYPKKQTFSVNDTIFISPCIRNGGPVHYNGDLTYNVKIYKSDGTLAAEKEKTVDLSSVTKEALSYEYKVKGVEFEGLDAGSYRAEIEINSSRDIVEAYYINNGYSFSFDVLEQEEDPDLFISFSIVPPDEYETLEHASFTYGSFESIAYDSKYLIVSYYNKGEWTPWQQLENYEDPDNLPEQTEIAYNGHMVKFGVLFVNDASHTKSGKDEFTVIAAEPQKLSIPNLFVKKADSCTEEFTPLEAGATKLAEGEQLAFTVINDSDPEWETVDGSYTLSIELPSGEVIETDEVSFTMTINEKEKLFVINELDFGVPLQGKCVVRLDLRTIINGGFTTAVESIELGTLRFGEIPSSVVTTGSDTVDDHDGLISLREAYEFCKSSGGKYDTVTFDKSMRDKSVILDEPLVIDSPVTIDGSYVSVTEEGDPVLLGIYFNGYDDNMMRYKTNTLFSVTENGDLHIKGINANYVQGDTGVFVRNDGGKVFIENCVIGSCNASEKGGGIYTDGGRVIVKNSSFYGTSGSKGGILYMTGGADVDMLNVMAMFASADTSVIENDGGDLDIVYCDFISCRTMLGEASDGCVVVSRGNTNIIACRITNDLMYPEMHSLSGDIKVYASVMQNADEKYYKSGDNVKANEFDVYPQGEFVNIIDYKMVYGEDGGYNNILVIIPEVLMQTKVNVASVGGALAYTVDGSEYKNTGISAGFDAGEYDKDSLGRSRVNYPSQGSVRGEYCEISPAPDKLPEPQTSEPEISDPASSEPASSEPASSEPESSEPESSEPASSEPESSEPGSKTSVFPTVDPDGKDTPATGERSGAMCLPIIIALSASLVMISAFRKKRGSNR